MHGRREALSWCGEETPRERLALMSVRIEGRAEELLKAKNFCHVATLRPDGSVQTAPVWVDVQDGQPVVNSAEGRSWPRNLERDPRVTLTVQNMENPYEYLEVRGRVAERTHEGADEHIDRLAKKYMDKDSYPFRQPGEERVIIRIEPEHARVWGG
jgi:PPOX class probable F420-dependent enzyme